jgi:hypothetical protein
VSTLHPEIYKVPKDGSILSVATQLQIDTPTASLGQFITGAEILKSALHIDTIEENRDTK